MPKPKSHNDSKKHTANILKTKDNVGKVDTLKNVEEGVQLRLQKVESEKIPQQQVNGPRIVEINASQEIYNRELPDDTVYGG